MAQTVESLPTRAREPDAEPQAIEAALNYIVDDGTKIFTETGAPGANDRRSGGKPRRVAPRDGRHLDFILELDGFHIIRHDTKVTPAPRRSVPTAGRYQEPTLFAKMAGGSNGS
jgi:hypothetical protein